MVGIGGRRRAQRKRWRVTAAMPAVLALLVPASPAGAAPSAADQAATLAYVRAYTAFERANLAALPSAVAGVRVQAAHIEAECPGVLAGGPQRPMLSGPGGHQRRTGREQGEAERTQRQLGYIELELAHALFSPLADAERANLPAFAAAVLPLRWSDSSIAEAVRARVEEENAAEPVDICADLRFWAGRGYKEVSPATRAFVVADAARLGTLDEPLGLLGRYENRAAKAELDTLKLLRLRAESAEQPLLAVERSLQLALGLHPFEPGSLHRGKPGVEVARGRTAAGERWVARVRHGGGCRLDVEVASGAAGDERSDGWCVERRGRDAEPSVNCGEGRLTITSLTLPRTTLVRLRLSDGRTIASAPIRVPPRLGGPVGLYYQVVRGPSPIPRLLTELDAGGHVVRITHLPAVVECTGHPIKYLPGGIRTLATGVVPAGGPRFAIVAERYRFLGKVYVDLKLHVQEEPAARLLLGGSRSVSFGFPPTPLRKAVSPLEEESDCSPHPWQILYGLLRKTRETVLASNGGPPVPLTVVPLPSSLHTRGVLVYGVFSPPPTELQLRSASGTTLASEPLETQEFVERCEGEAEPGGPIPG